MARLRFCIKAHHDQMNLLSLGFELQKQSKASGMVIETPGRRVSKLETSLRRGETGSRHPKDNIVPFLVIWTWADAIRQRAYSEFEIPA
jgi:hypothetical protein